MSNGSVVALTLLIG